MQKENRLKNACKTKTEKAFINTTDTQWESRRSVNPTDFNTEMWSNAKIQK